MIDITHLDVPPPVSCPRFIKKVLKLCTIMLVNTTCVPHEMRREQGVIQQIKGPIPYRLCMNLIFLHVPLLCHRNFMLWELITDHLRHWAKQSCSGFGQTHWCQFSCSIVPCFQKISLVLQSGLSLAMRDAWNEFKEGIYLRLVEHSIKCDLWKLEVPTWPEGTPWFLVNGCILHLNDTKFFEGLIKSCATRARVIFCPACSYIIHLI